LNYNIYLNELTFWERRRKMCVWITCIRASFLY